MRSRLARRQWMVTVEVVTPPPGDASARDRVLALAAAVRRDARIAGLALTDRTASPDADPVTFAPEVASHGKAPLVHLAGKGRDTPAMTDVLRRAHGAGVRAVLLTGGDAMAGETARMDAVDMLALARATVPDLLRLGILAPHPGRPLEATWDRAVAKREAGAAALVTQVSWDLDAREALGRWQGRLGLPFIGAVMLLTRGRLQFLADHRIAGIVVPPALRERVAKEAAGDATRRLALDLVLLRRLGYAGAHVSGVLSPERVNDVLDQAARLDQTLGEGWREVWREATGIA